MAQIFGYDDDWKAATLTCPKCGWSGRFQEGRVELHAQLADSSCPRCPWLEAPMLAIVSYPTPEEVEANTDSPTEFEKELLVKLEK